VLTTILLASLILPAAEPLRVAWDCYLPGDRVQCTALQQAHFSALPFVVQVPAESADLVVTVRSQRVPTGRAYSLSFAGAGERPSFVLEDRVLDTVADDGLLLRLVGTLQRGMAPYLELVAPGRAAEDGTLSLRLRDPAAAPASASKGDTSTGWYLAPSVSAAASRDSIDHLRVGGSLVANWSSPAWRLRASGGMSYRRWSLEQEDGADPLVYEALSGGTSLVAAHVLWQGLTIGTSTIVGHDPPDNQIYVVRPRFGLEWVLHPFLETDESNVGVRYLFGGENVLFFRENIRGNTRESFLLHEGAGFLRWHFARADAQVTVGAKSILDDVDFSSVFGNASFTWRVTDELWLTASGDLSVRNQLINAPATPPENPLEQIFSGKSFGTFQYSTSIGLSYAFGNSLLDSQDQRWRW
jgi:hypothetical protein